MFRKSLKLSIAVVVIASYIMLLFGEGYAAAPTVKLVVNPDTTDVYAGSEPVVLTAETSGSGLTFKWELQGPGKIEGKGSEISYIVPETIRGVSAQATITVTVTDEAGQEITETVTFNILASKTPAPKPAKKGMSMGTKVALGVGAAALLGGGIALAAGGGGDDNDNGPFAGTWKREYVGQFDDGTPAYYTITFNLEQKKNETSITGNRVVTLTATRCCTASFTVSVTGTVYDETSAILSWGPGRGRCEDFFGCWIEVWHDGGSYGYILVDNGRILRSFPSGSAEYIRMFVAGRPEIDTEGNDGEILRIEEGDYIRQ